MKVKELISLLGRLPKGDENAEIRFTEYKGKGVRSHNIDKVERMVDKKGNLLWVSLV